MQNRLWKGPLHLGLMMLIGAGWVTGVEPFTRSVRPVSAQEINQDNGQTIRGRLDVDSQELEGIYFNVHQFEAEAGRTIVIEMLGSEFSAAVALIAPNGDIVASDVT